MYKAKVIDVNSVYSQADNSYFIDVTVEIFKGDGKDAVKVDTRKFGYPLGTTKEAILVELEKLCETLASDEEVGKKSALLDKQLTEVQNLKKTLVGDEEKPQEPQEK